MFREDDRGVTTQIGVVILFTLAIILFSIYQAAVVPNQNQATEFDHSRTIQNEMVELRNAILSAKVSGQTAFAETTLGTTYTNRLLAVNPPDPSGRLQTSQARPIEVSADGSTANLCAGSDTPYTRNVRFQPGYNEYRNAPDIIYENTVLYLDFGDRKITLTDEQFLENGGETVNLVLVNTSLFRQGFSTESIELVPGNIRKNDIDNANITVPTNLSESHWEDLLQEDIDPSNVTVSDGNLTVETGGTIALSCSPVGINEEPIGGKRSGDALDINPAGPNDVSFQSVSRSGDTVTVNLNNTADRNTNITDVRIPFYFAGQTGGTSDPDPFDVIWDSNTVAQGLNVADPIKETDPEIELPGNSSITSIGFNFNNLAGNPSSDFYGVKFRFENGETGTYFIDVPN